MIKIQNIFYAAQGSFTLFLNIGQIDRCRPLVRTLSALSSDFSAIFLCILFPQLGRKATQNYCLSKWTLIFFTAKKDKLLEE